MGQKTSFGGKMLKKDQLEDPGTDGRKLKAIIRKENGRLCDGSFWLRIQTSGAPFYFLIKWKTITPTFRRGI
jgi:hypothetical protein